MKKTLILISFIYANLVFSQIAIGKTSVTNSSVSLEFYDNSDNSKGLVLPWTSTVQNIPTTYTPSTGAGYSGMTAPIIDGTMILDLFDKKIKYMKSGSWFDLTGDPIFPLVLKDSSNNDIIINSFSVDSSLQDNKKEISTAKVNMGMSDLSNNTAGILVLTDKNKAMILPKVASPHLNIINPAAGMITYDTVAKQFAVFNGSVWSFWKP